MTIKQKDILLHLKKKETFPHTVTTITILETHISWVFLTGTYAYKIKKQVKFGEVLDFSNLRLRKKFCQKEVILNRQLCGNMYQGVVKIVKTDGEYKIVRLKGAGSPLEFAVKMLEIPQRYRMDNLIQRNIINESKLDVLVKALVKFHTHAYTNAVISNFGRPFNMRTKIKENFTTLPKLTSKGSLFERRLISFVKDNDELFDRRIKESRIRDIHGDLRLKNIFFLKGKFLMYDRIEFNDSLRFADISEDVAHLAMDLDFYQREDLRQHFISQYIRKSEDTSLIYIIYFMMCYKACVRAKVSLFRACQIASGNKRERLEYVDEAQRHFTIAKKYVDLF
jgi:aminoglycoside phosphotransferase family enzyme